MSGTFKFKVKLGSKAGAGTAAPAPSASVGSALPASSLTTSAPPPAVPPPMPYGSAFPAAAGVKRKADDAGEQQGMMKRQHSQTTSAMGAAPGGGGNKIRINIKGAGMAASLNPAASVGSLPAPMGLQGQPSVSMAGQIAAHGYHTAALAAAAPAWGQPPPPAHWPPAQNAAGSVVQPADKKVQKAQAQAQARAHKAQQKQAEREAKEAEQQQADALQQVMGQVFGQVKKPNTIKLKVKTSSLAGVSAPPVPAPAPAAPAPGMVPLPAANGFNLPPAPSHPKPIVKVKFKPKPAPSYAAPFIIDGGVQKPAAVPVPRLPPVPMQRGPPAPGRGQRGGRGRGAGFGRGAVPRRRATEEDDDYDPSNDMDFDDLAPSARQAMRQGVPGAAQARAPLPVCMRKVVETLVKYDAGQGGHFKEPVPEDKAPGYYQKILHPMCLDVVSGKLATGMYFDWPDFEADLRLIWDNARLYNPSDNLVHHLANYMDELSQKLLKLAKAGQVNFRAVGETTTKRYIKLWVQKQASMQQKGGQQMRGFKPAPVMRNPSLPAEGLPPAMANRVVQRKVKPQPAAAAAQPLRHSSVAAGGGRQHQRPHGFDMEHGRLSRLGGRNKQSVRAAQQRLIKATDPDARKMAAVYVRRNEAEDLREQYPVRVPWGLHPVSVWRGLAGGANAEGTDYAAGNPALRPTWPAALYPNTQAALQAHNQGGASYQGQALPQNAYVRSMARFVKRCHPALRNVLVAQRLATCIAVEGAPEPAPAATHHQAPTPGPSSATPAAGAGPVAVPPAPQQPAQPGASGAGTGLQPGGAAGQQPAAVQPDGSRGQSPELAASALMMLAGATGGRAPPPAASTPTHSAAKGQQNLQLLPQPAVAQLLAKQQAAGLSVQAANGSPAPANAPVLHLGTGGNSGAAGTPAGAAAVQPGGSPPVASATEQEDSEMSGSPLPDLPPASPSE